MTCVVPQALATYRDQVEALLLNTLGMLAPAPVAAGDKGSASGAGDAAQQLPQPQPQQQQPLQRQQQVGRSIHNLDGPLKATLVVGDTTQARC